MNFARYKSKSRDWWMNSPFHLARWIRAKAREFIRETDVGHVIWEYGGHPHPAPHRAKRKAVREYAHKYGTRILVETGTRYGDMIHAMLPYFDRLISIELGEDLFETAQQRFAREPKVELLLGDSAQKLPELLPTLSEPVLFWLDGHYSGGDTAKGNQATPISEELSAILKRAHDDPQGVGRSVILIDDARCFGTWRGYPTLSTLRAAVIHEAPNCSWEVRDNTIRIVLAE